MASDVKWIKITTDIFDDEKILLIESLPDAYAIIVVWFKLLCLAGKQNNSGVFMIGDKMPYTDKMLATIFRMKETTVQLALTTFEQFGMVEIIDGVITIPNWGKHQNIDQLQARKEYMQNYMREYREKQKLLTGGTACKVNSKVNSKVNVNEAEEERESEEDKRKKNKNDISSEPVRPSDVQRIIDNWNSLGLNKVKAINPDTTRYSMLRKRLKDYGVDTIIEGVDKIRNSSFLQGHNNKGWTVTFDWFIKPDNFQKVIDGNYDERKTAPHNTRTGAERMDDLDGIF